MSGSLSEIRHLDPDNRGREQKAVRVLIAVLATLGTAAAALAITLRVRRR